MKTFYRIIWWTAFIVGAILIQQFIPGIDALAPGFLLSLQEQRKKQTLWLFFIFVLIQDGSGSLLFGAAVLWYGGQVLFFRLSSLFFVEDNIVFIFILSACLGLYHGLLTWFMAAIQTIHLDFVLLLRESIIQAIIIPIIWGLAYFTRPRSTLGGAQ
ncbi:MAG: hypothetical protein LBN33_02450 [Desulfovibrio sp.]|jgi:hypothetical protein|nr:hypothetical protein [Desulfovibrio sp.]